MKHKINEFQITAHSQGGLGNQLFIIAAGYSKAMQTGKTFNLDDSLHSFPSMREFRAIKFLNNSLANTTQRQSRWSRARLALQNLNLFNSCGITEKNFDEANTGCMWGYFQSEEFHKFGQTEIYASFLNSMKQLASPEFNSIPEDGSVTVHIRRGDYLTLASSDILGCLTFDYYAKVLKNIEGSINVISDDKNAAENLSHLLPERKVLKVSGRTEFDDILFLANSAKLVLANSSFSWWGAVLGHKDKLVVAPKDWYKNPPTFNKPIHAKSWQLAESEFESI